MEPGNHKVRMTSQTRLSLSDEVFGFRGSVILGLVEDLRFATAEIHFHLRITMKLASLLLLASLTTSTVNAQLANKPIRVAIVGLVHGHVKGFLAALPKNPNAQLVAIVEPNANLAQQYASQYHLSQSLFDTDLEHIPKPKFWRS